MIGSVLALLFGIFPAPFAILVLSIVSISIIVAFFKIISLVLDAIPFL